MELGLLEALAILQGVALVGGMFYYGGRVSRTLELLVNTARDHEDRLRKLERRPALAAVEAPRANG